LRLDLTLIRLAVPGLPAIHVADGSQTTCR
jgi:hypothetical protein